MERLGRGLVAVHVGSGKVYAGWRLLGTGPRMGHSRTTPSGIGLPVSPALGGRAW